MFLLLLLFFLFRSSKLMLSARFCSDKHIAVSGVCSPFGPEEPDRTECESRGSEIRLSPPLDLALNRTLITCTESPESYNKNKRLLCVFFPLFHMTSLSTVRRRRTIAVRADAEEVSNNLSSFRVKSFIR